MNKIFIEDITSDKSLCFKEDAIVVIKNSNGKIDYLIDEEVKVFTLVLFSNLDFNYSIKSNTSISVFSVDSSLNVELNVIDNGIHLDYAYSTINKNDNSYVIDIKHFGNDIVSLITNHGINTESNKLSFVINTIVPKEFLNIKTNQDSKIITLKDNNCTIKPNLFIDNDDIEANHAAYIGKFKEDELFYLMTRGIEEKQAENLLVRSFLINNMNISFEEKEIILDTIKKYWR